jgi:hypothetical protein
VRDQQGNKVTSREDVAEITMALSHALVPTSPNNA